MIQIEGGFWLQLDLGSKTDFIDDPEDLLEFTVVESCGNSLPEFTLIFLTRDETILPLLHEGTIIKATYGQGTQNLATVVCYSGKLVTMKEGGDDRMVTTNGLCVDQAYITDNTLKLYDKASGVEVVTKKLNERFNVLSNITSSKDSQVWIQPSISDKAFVSKTLMHSDLGDSFPLTAICADGAFILKDAIKAIREEKPKWNFVNSAQDANDIQVLADGITNLDTTFINNWTGYEKITKVLNILKGTISDVSTAFKPLLSMSRVAEKMSDVTYRYKGFKAQSDSVHDNYWASADRNLVFMTQLSKVEVTHSFADTYKAVRPLDLAFIKEYGTNGQTSSDYTSGLYIVCAVSRTIQGKRFTTTLGFNRESMNSIKNLGG